MISAFESSSPQVQNPFLYRETIVLLPKFCRHTLKKVQIILHRLLKFAWPAGSAFGAKDQIRELVGRDAVGFLFRDFHQPFTQASYSWCISGRSRPHPDRSQAREASHDHWQQETKHIFWKDRPVKHTRKPETELQAERRSERHDSLGEAVSGKASASLHRHLLIGAAGEPLWCDVYRHVDQPSARLHHHCEQAAERHC